MSIPTMTQAKIHLRQIEADLDPAIAIAIDAAQSELDNFIGGAPSAERWPDEESVPGAVLRAALLLVEANFEPNTPEAADLLRAIAQKLLLPYRVDSGMRAA